MRQVLTLLFQLIFITSLSGQTSKRIDFNFESFDLKDSINDNLTFEQIINQIESYCSNDTQKLCLVAGWIYDNIDFDLEKFNTSGGVNDYETVFYSRKGTCGDYSSIFSEFCDQLNIPNQMIEGYVPEYNSENLVYYETNHAWNIIQLGDTWYHCDLLGFSGYLDIDSIHEFKFIKRPNPENFLTQEVEFIAYHIPADPMWQLSNYPIPLDTLIAYKEHSQTDTNAIWFDYVSMIDNYMQLPELEKSLEFADHAFGYNGNNSNVIIVNYYNAAVVLVNNWDNDKNRLIKAKEYLEKAKNHVGNAKNGVEILRVDIDNALELLSKYVP